MKTHSSNTIKRFFLFALLSLFFLFSHVFSQTPYTTTAQDYYSNAQISPDVFSPCSGGDLYFSGEDSGLKITEIGFDGTDEWIEITNFGPPFESAFLSLSGAKNRVVTITGVTLAPMESIIFGDSLSQLTGYQGVAITGLGLSIPDTTGFTIALLDSNMNVLDEASFAPDIVAKIPNNTTLSYHSLLDATGSDYLISPLSFWQPTLLEESLDINVLANPGIAYCANLENNNFDPDADTGDTTDDPANTTTGDTTDDPANTTTGDTTDDPANTTTGDKTNDPANTTTGDTTNDPADATTGDITDDPADATTGDITDDPADATTGDITDDPTDADTGDITDDPTDADTGDIIDEQIPAICSFSEIHSTLDILPEFIEVYCETTFSGSLTFAGIGVGTALKSVSLHIPAGGYAVFTSNTGAFSTPTFYIPGLSLTDAGEAISLTGSIISGKIAGFVQGETIAFPSTKKGESYYPFCRRFGSNYEIFGTSTPGMDNVCKEIVVYTPPATQSSTTTQNQQQTQQTETKKLTTVTKTGASEKKPTTTKTGSTVKKPTATTKTGSTVKKTTTTAKKATTTATSKATTTAKKTITAKKSTSTTKTTTTKGPTKAQQVLQKEHDVYKNYVDFLHSYLKSHLYTQFTTLKLPEVQSMLKKSLQTAKQNNIMITYSGENPLSILDFDKHWARQFTGALNSDDLVTSLKKRWLLIKNSLQSPVDQTDKSLVFLTPLVKKYFKSTNRQNTLTDMLLNPLKTISSKKQSSKKGETTTPLDENNLSIGTTAIETDSAESENSSLSDPDILAVGNQSNSDTSNDITDTKTSETNSLD